MKPVRLAIAGLNSFRDRQVIDFTRLTELGMFGIFGPTGSGKSSILDAITLALYGKVVRVGQTQGILNQAEDRLEVSFDFDIGSAGHRKRYRTERAYRRGGGDFSLTNQASRLLLLEPLADGGDYGLVVVAEGQREVNQAILGIVGLRQEDFTRAVVLPQGKFAEFLQLTGRSRNEMTERLFGLQKYGQSLLNRANDRAREASVEREKLAAQQGELGDASETAVLQAATALEEARERLRTAGVHVEQARTRFREMRQIYEWMTQLHSVEAELGGLESRAGEIVVVQQSLHRHGQATAVWPLVRTWKDAEAAAREAGAMVASALAEKHAAESALDTAVAARDRARAQRAEAEPQWMVQRAKLEEAYAVESALRQTMAELDAARSDLQSARQRYDHAVASRDRLQGESDEAERDRETTLKDAAAHTVSPHTRQQITELGAAHQKWRFATRDADSEEKKLADRQTQLQLAEDEIRKWTNVEQTLAREQEALGLRIERWNAQTPTVAPEKWASLEQWQIRAELKMDGLRVAERDIAAWRKRTEEAEKASEAARARLDALRASAAQAEQVWRSMEDEYQTHLATNESRWIARLQSQLQEGEPCAVCGATHHPGRGVEVIDGAATFDGSEWSAEQMEALSHADETWQRQQNDVHTGEVAVAQALTVLDSARQNTAERERQLADGLSELAALWTADVAVLVGGGPAPVGRGEWESFMTAFKNALHAAQQEQRTWEQGSEALQNETLTLNDKIQDAKRQLGIAQSRERTARDEVTGQQMALAGAIQVKQAERGTLLEAMRGLGLPAEESATVAEMDASIASRLEQVREDDRLANKARQAVKELDTKLTIWRGQLKEHQEQVQADSQTITRIGTRAEQLERDVHTGQNQLQGYTGGIPVAEAMRRVEQALMELKNASTRTEKAADDATKRFQTAQQASVKAETMRDEKAGVLQQHHARVMEALASFRFATVEEVEDALLCGDDVEERTKMMDVYNDAVARSKNRRSDLKKQLDGRSVDEQTLEFITQEVQGAEAEHQRAVETHGVAKVNHEQLLQRKERWENLEQERLAADALATRLDAITRVLRGNAFVRYVAQEQMEVVARQASDRLSGLTRGRYALTFDENGDFLMRDDHNGGSTRPVNTLSGGETFLTSLSLALALSAHIQLRGQHPLEFFFLDEGFGTLDPDLLDVVVSSLEKLNLDRMSIGLISHVPELRQRMQRRLIVDPALPAGRGTQVRVEMA